MKVKKGDNVTIISGKDRGKSGKVLNIFPKNYKALIEGLNLRKKHVKPKKQGEKGQKIEVAYPLNISNIMVVCKSCGKRIRVGHKILEDKSKIRVCKKCGEEI